MMAIKNYRYDLPVSIAPLVTFRIVFGCLMFFSILRFWWRGWITNLYISPSFHFTYMGLEWVKPFGNTGMHLVFAILLLASLFIALGLYYRGSIIAFFCCFTYVELIEVAAYLNHYYFISLVAFIMIWLPCNRSYSLDALIKPERRKLLTPAWSVAILRFQLAVVYIFAGLAKLNADWLIHAEPMRTWLPSKSHLPLVGKYMYDEWVAYLFSWAGAAYDLFIVFFLLNRRTRPAAYIFVILFHVATAIFFPAIGMFPYVMIACSLIFFSTGFHERLLKYFPFYKKAHSLGLPVNQQYRYRHRKAVLAGVTIYIFFQLIIPMRFLFYPGHLFWHEQGYRFSWRVMLMEKSGAAYFTVKDKSGRQSFVVNNAEFLTPLQEKMMSTQPDMILRYAHFLAEKYRHRGVESPKVFAEIYVALNGARSRLFVDTTVDLAAQEPGWKHYSWILPYKIR